MKQEKESSAFTFCAAAFHVLPLQLHFQPTVDALSSLFGALESTKQKEKKKQNSVREPVTVK